MFQDQANEVPSAATIQPADGATNQAASLKEQMLDLANTFMERVAEELTRPERLLELSLVIFLVLLAKWWSGRLHGLVTRMGKDHDAIQKADRRFVTPLMSGLLALAFVWLAQIGLEMFYDKAYFLDIAVSMLAAWVVIRLFAGFIASRELARILAITAWLLAALNIMGVLDDALGYMDNISLGMGETAPSLLDVIQAIIVFGLLLWVASFVTGRVDSQIKKVESVPPSARVLVVKASRIGLIVIAFMIALNSTGIDMTAFAVFGGALGVGLGFGLQKVVGNFISGIILLLDRSIKPGDVVEVGATYGKINKLAARYTSVITRDGTEFLIPNEDMITQPVINWSHTNKLVRRRIPVQISYDSDLRLAMSLMVKAADQESRVLKIPAPRTLLRGFGADGVDLELRMWIDDPQDGVSNIGSEVMLHIWDLFHENGIEFPYPQRVVHISRPKDMELSEEEEEMVAGGA